jgi:hypothetical protein
LKARGPECFGVVQVFLGVAVKTLAFDIQRKPEDTGYPEMPESLALLLSYTDSREVFADYVIASLEDNGVVEKQSDNHLL